MENTSVVITQIYVDGVVMLKAFGDHVYALVIGNEEKKAVIFFVLHSLQECIVRFW
jgi:hypothetical protein